MKPSASLTSRLTVAYTLFATLLISATTIFLYWSLARALDHSDEQLLRARVESIRSLLSLEDQGQTLRWRIEREWPGLTSVVSYVRLLDERGQVFVTSPDPGGVFAHVEKNCVANAERKMVEVGDRRLRTFCTQLSQGKARYEVQLAVDRTETTALLTDYRNRLILVLVVGCLGSALLCFQLTRQGLRPIRTMAKKAAKISSSNLDERVSSPRMPYELAHLAKSFDEMLARLRDSFERSQRFSADIAHELRTPVSNISGELQVALGKDRSVEFYKETMGSCLEECSRLSRILEALLFLAQAENPRIEMPRERINLKRELEATLDFYEPAAAENGIVCSLEAEEELWVNAERTLFQRAIGNIISNAIKQTKYAGSIQIKASRREDRIQIEVSDSGVGIAREHLPFLFDRFYRVDASRATHSGGAGLGLAIVKSIAQIHGGDVAIASDVGKGTTVRLRFPAPV